MIVNMLQCSGQPPQQRIIKLKMSVVLRLRNPAINILELCSGVKFLGNCLIPLGPAVKLC